MGKTADPTAIVRAIVEQTVVLLTSVGMDADAVPMFLARQMIGRLFLDETTTDERKIDDLRILAADVDEQLGALTKPDEGEATH